MFRITSYNVCYTKLLRDNISFDLYEGETLGIIGINGAGKSTILKQIAGVTTPTSGEIIKSGRVTALLELGTGFNNELTGFENIYLNGTFVITSYSIHYTKLYEFRTRYLYFIF